MTCDAQIFLSAGSENYGKPGKAGTETRWGVEPHKKPYIPRETGRVREKAGETGPTF